MCTIFVFTQLHYIKTLKSATCFNHYWAHHVYVHQMILYKILFIQDHLIYIQQTINYLKEGKYRIFSNLIRTPFYSFRGLKIRCRLDLRS